MSQTHEKLSKSSLDALLVHVMGAEPDQDRPHLRGRSIVWAATYLSYALEVPHLVFAGHHYWGETERLPLGEVTAQEAVQELQRAHLHRNITILPSFPDRNSEPEPVTDTSGEVMAFLDFARHYNFQRIASISSETHLPTIRQLYAHRGVKAAVLSAEEVLQSIPGQIGQQAYAKHITEIRSSNDEKDFRKREILKWFLYSAPFKLGETWLREKSKKDRKISSRPLTEQTLHT